MCHGFPESWYSWRHQLPALAEAGFRAVAPDMRGYGGTDAPPSPLAYSQLHHVGDMVGLLDALGVETASIIGHDWGGPVAWTSALLRPDRFTSVSVLGVPWSPRPSLSPIELMRLAFADSWFYFLWFQEPGVAEAELEPNVEAFLRGFYFTISADAPVEALTGLAGAPGGGILERLLQPAELPAWLTAEDLAFYVGEFERTGFRGGLSWYRSANLTWEVMAPFDHLRVRQPALFVHGDREPVIAMSPGALEAMPETVPGLDAIVAIPGCGHWTQQEKPAEVNAAVLAFLAEHHR